MRGYLNSKQIYNHTAQFLASEIFVRPFAYKRSNPNTAVLILSSYLIDRRKIQVTYGHAKHVPK